MAARETYVLHLYRSRAVRGWQWAARLEHVQSGESLRFTDPEALLAHLRTVLRAGEPDEPGHLGESPEDRPGSQAEEGGSRAVVPPHGEATTDRE
jgi:hypothetical protein